MTELERRVEACKCDVESAKLALREADLKLQHGERLMSEAKEKYGSLKIAVEQAKITLRKEESYLEVAETDAEKKIESN